MSYSNTTFATAKSMLSSRMDNPSFYVDDELGIYINEGIRVWNLWTGYWRYNHRFDSVSGQVFYDVNLLKVLRVEYAGIPIERDSMFNLDFAKCEWQSDEPYSPVRWFPVGLNIIGINPPCSGGMEINAIGIRNAPVMTSETDAIDADEWVIDAILDYAQHIATFKSGGTEFKNSMGLMQRFRDQAAIQNEKFKFTSIYRNSLGKDLEGMMHPQWKKAKK